MSGVKTYDTFSGTFCLNIFSTVGIKRTSLPSGDRGGESAEGMLRERPCSRFWSSLPAAVGSESTLSSVPPIETSVGASLIESSTVRIGTGMRSAIFISAHDYTSPKTRHRFERNHAPWLCGEHDLSTVISTQRQPAAGMNLSTSASMRNIAQQPRSVLNATPRRS